MCVEFLLNNTKLREMFIQRGSKSDLFQDEETLLYE